MNTRTHEQLKSMLTGSAMNGTLEERQVIALEVIAESLIKISLSQK